MWWRGWLHCKEHDLDYPAWDGCPFCRRKRKKDDRILLQINIEVRG